MSNIKDHLFSDFEIRKLIEALSRSGEPFSEDDAQAVLLWATEMRIGYAMLSLALKGRKAFVVRDGEVNLTNNAEKETL